MTVRKRAMWVLAVGVTCIVVALVLKETGVLQNRKALADREFALSERAHHEGDAEAAVRHMQNAVKLDPHFVEAREGLAALYEQHRGMDAAIEEYKRAIQEDPQNEARYCYRIAQIYFLNRQWEQALQWARRADSLQANDFHVLRLIGFCLERQGNWQAAEQHWAEVAKKFENEQSIQRSLSRVRKHLNQQKTAQTSKGG